MLVYIGKIIYGLYGQEASVTSLGIRGRLNIGRSCLSGIVHFSLITHFNEVS